MLKRSRSVTTMAAIIFAVGTLGLNAPGWAQKSFPGRITDIASNDGKADSSITTTSSTLTTASSMTASRQISGRPLTRSEGLALVKVALTQPDSPDEQPDCSHLVHQIFQAGGLDYPYAPSFTLYDGITEFQRVSTPQPGDIVVWQGHVGMVVDPEEHSFYSSVGSGFETERYDSDYWRGRGPSRFYRYLAGASTDIAALKKPPQRPAAQIPNEENSAENNSQQPASSLIASKSTGDLRRPASSTNDYASTKPFQVPLSIPVPSTQAKPTSDDVNEAISELTNASGGVLRTDALAASSSVVIFDQLRIEKTEVKRDKGWAEVRVDYRVELNQGKLQSQHHSEKRRWELQRKPDGWTVVRPADRIYVPTGIAEQVISERLYRLTRKSSDKNRSEQASLARLLDAVFN